MNEQIYKELRQLCGDMEDQSVMVPAVTEPWRVLLGILDHWGEARARPLFSADLSKRIKDHLYGYPDIVEHTVPASLLVEVLEVVSAARSGEGE